jgi:hypothetical protein
MRFIILRNEGSHKKIDKEIPQSEYKNDFLGEPALEKGANNLCLYAPLFLMLSGCPRYFGSLLPSLSRANRFIHDSFFHF